MKAGSYTYTKHRNEIQELKLDGDVDVNASVESCADTTIDAILEKCEVKGRLILAVVLRPKEGNIYFNELRCKYRKLRASGDDDGPKGLSLDSCLKGFSNEEVLGGNDQWYCNKCKEHRDITKKMEIFTTPKILVLHLKRFQSRRGSSSRGGVFGLMYAQIAGQEKNDAMVEYPVEGLDMREHVISLRNAPEPILYDLIGVSNHFGSLGGGHYTASCLNANFNKWCYFNDSSVGSCSKSQIVSPAAYLLFYRRRE